MTIKKISVITLTYNNWRLLERAINSVDSQVIDERYEVEYIIVDDGTKDFNIKDVENILLTTSLNYKIVVNESNLGTVASFNKAIKFSQGDIIIPLAADDEFYNDNVVNEISNSFGDNNVDILTTFRVPIVNGEEGPSLPDARKIRLFDCDCNVKLLKELMCSSNFVSGASTYYRRSLFEKIGYFDEKYRLLEDYPFYVKALTLGVKINFLDIKSIRYGMDGVSTSTNINPLLKKDYEIFNQHLYSLPYLSAIERRTVFFKKVMSRKERYRNAIFYPEQLLLMLFKI